MYDDLVKALRVTRERVRKHPEVAMYVPPYQLSAASDAIEALSKPRWIPVTERLPGIGEDVLFSVGRGLYVAEGCLRADGDWTQFRWDTIQPKDVVDAWMPLPAPEPPKEEA